MSGINFLSDNFYKSGTPTLTTGAENAQFPLVNLKNDSPSIKFRSSGNTVVMEIDLLQTRDIDTLAVVGSPLETFGMTTVTFKTATTTDFSGSPVYSVTLKPLQNIGFAYITEVSHRFVEVTFTGQGSYVELGHIFIGKRINLPNQNLSISSFRYDYDDKSDSKENDYGQVFINERPLVKGLGGALETCDLGEQETLDNMFIKHGKHEPLWMIVDKDGVGMTDGDSKLTIYGYLSTVPKWTGRGGQHYNTTLRIKASV